MKITSVGTQGLRGTAITADSGLKPQTQHAICIEAPYLVGAPVSAASLASRVAEALHKERLRRKTRQPLDAEDGTLSIEEAWDQPLSLAAFLDEISFTPDKPDKFLTGFDFQVIPDGDKPRRPTRNLDKGHRSRAKHREECRHDPSEFSRLVTDQVIDGLVLNGDELDSEPLDVLSEREENPGIEVFRRGIIIWSRAGEPFPYSELYFDHVAQRLNAMGGLRRPRTFSRTPGAVSGKYSACAEQGISLDELETVIADGSKPIIRRSGIVIALRKRELPKRPKYPAPPAEPTSSEVRSFNFALDKPATAPTVNDNPTPSATVAAA
jgi:hypothetical protein